MLPELYEKYKHLEDLKVFWGGKSKKITNVREYLERYFKNGTKVTKFKDGTIQCYPQRNRSFYDLFFIVKARFKEITEEELAFNLIDMIKNQTLKIILCGDTMKTVFYTPEMHGYGLNYNEIQLNSYKSLVELKYGNELSIMEIVLLAKNYKQQ